MSTAFWIVPILHIHLTLWKLIGFTGGLIFSARWIVQVQARRAGNNHLPKMFWYMSAAGSVLCLLYFIFGKNDAVGVLQNAFPAAVAFFNLYLIFREKDDGNRLTKS